MRKLYLTMEHIKKQILKINKKYYNIKMEKWFIFHNLGNYLK